MDLAKCMPGDNQSDSCTNGDNYCDWQRKLTHIYKKMIASFHGRDTMIINQIQIELAGDWNKELPGNANTILIRIFIITYFHQ